MRQDPRQAYLRDRALVRSRNGLNLIDQFQDARKVFFGELGYSAAEISLGNAVVALYLAGKKTPADWAVSDDGNAKLPACPEGVNFGCLNF